MIQHINLSRALYHYYVHRPAMAKRLCACGCNNRVNQKTESRHLNRQGPSLLASSVLSQSLPLAQNRGQGSQPRPKSSHRPAKQELIGRPGLLRRRSLHCPTNSDRILLRLDFGWTPAISNFPVRSESNRTPSGSNRTAWIPIGLCHIGLY